MALGRTSRWLPGDEDDTKRLFRACWLLDVALARRNIFKDTKIFSLNPKAFGQGLIDSALSVESKIQTTHMFMYRAPQKVVESFGSIFTSNMPLHMRSALHLLKLLTALKVKSPGVPMFRSSLRDRVNIIKATLPLHPVACNITTMWLEAVQTFLDKQQKHAHDGIGLASGEALVLRMDEFVTKDIEKRRQGVEAILTHVGVDASNKGTITAAMDVFNTHSQKGSHMSKKRDKFLSADDEALILECARACIRSTYARVEEDNCNFIIDAPLVTRQKNK